MSDNNFSHLMQRLFRNFKLIILFLNNIDSWRYLHNLLLNNLLWNLIKCTCCFIENKNLWLSDECPSNRDSLLLASWKQASSFSALGVKSRIQKYILLICTSLVTNVPTFLNLKLLYVTITLLFQNLFF